MDRILKASTLWVDGPRAASQPHLGCTAQGVAPGPASPGPGLQLLVTAAVPAGLKTVFTN